jgi:periplasmic protein TonB
MSPVVEHGPRKSEKVPLPPLYIKQTIAVPMRDTFFADILLEADNKDKSRRRWAATTSVVIQCVALGLLLMVPLLFTEALPKTQLLTYLVAPPPPPPPPPAAAPAPVQVVRRVQSDILDGRLRAPSRIPQRVQMIQEDEAPPPLSGTGVIGGVVGGVPGGQIGGVIGGIINSANASVPKLVVAPPKRVRVSSGVVAGLIIKKVEPEYPAMAKTARIQGDVVLTAIISKEGAIENLQVESGHPLLIQSAIAAVKQWRYRPFFVSGEPVEVETRVVVTFRFAN